MKVPIPKLGCERCKGNLEPGWHETFTADEVKSIACVCRERLRLFRYVGYRIYAAIPEADWSVLLPSEEGDRTRDNLFIRGAQSEVDRHLRWVLRNKYRLTHGGFRFRFVSDDQIINAYLGKCGEGDVVYETVEELVAEPELVIIELGVYQNRNKALSNEVLHACTIRQSKAKPTWVLEGAYKLEPGHHCYSERLSRHLEQHFETIELGVQAAEPMQPAELTVPGTSFDEPRKPTKKRPPSRRESLADAFHDED